MASAWREFDDMLARRRDGGRATVFWWRDDDAAAPTPEAARLLRLSAASGVPLALAVVPQAADPALFASLHEGITVIQHGADHRNRAGPGEKKTEFPAAEPEDEALARLAAARLRLAALGGPRTLPVLAPPWNRLRGALVRRLTETGLHGLSGYGPRASAAPAPGLTQVNTHVDIVAWRAGRGFIGETEALALALAHLASDAGEPTGWLTHHAVHDAAAWGFLERLFESTRRAGARWARPDEVFGPSPR